MVAKEQASVKNVVVQENVQTVEAQAQMNDVVAHRFVPQRSWGDKLAPFIDDMITKHPKLIMIDHDIEYSTRVLNLMRNHVKKAPDRAHVAPFLLYHNLPYPYWHMRRFIEGVPVFCPDTTWTECDSFAFGFTYVPQEEWKVIYEIVKNDHWQAVADNYGFQRWNNGFKPALIHWDCLVCHTHL